MNFEKELKELIEQAKKARSIDDWDKVIEQGEDLKQKTSKREDKQQVEEFLAKAYNSRGTASYLQLKDYQKAIKDYDKAIGLGFKFPVIYYNRGNAYLAQKKYPDAIKDYDKAIELGLKFSVIYYNRGNAYLELRDYKKAIKDYDTAVHLDPKLVIAYYNRGNAYLNQEKYTDAIEDYNTTISLDPNDALPHNGRGTAYLYQGKYTNAIKDYNTALDIKPSFFIAHYNRGNAYLAQKKYPDAIKDYNTALGINPNFSIAYYNCGNAYLAQENHSVAIESFKKAVRSVKNFLDKNNEAREFILTRKELYLTAQHKDFNDNDDSLFAGNLNDTTLKLLLELWQVVKDIKKDHEITDKEQPLKLAYYTSLETVHKLLPRTDDKENCFRLHNARDMNDPDEGKRLLREVEGLKNFYDKTTQEPNSHTFVAGFVKEKDENTEEAENALLMWIIYGKNTRGAKLTFPAQSSLTNYYPNTVPLELLSTNDTSNVGKGYANIPPSPLPMAVYKVKYKELEEENKKKISRILQSLDSSNHVIREYACYIIDKIRFLYKSEPYKFEEEYRIVWVTSKTDPRINLNESKKPYMNVENNDFLFKDKECAIWIGTGVEKKELVRDVVRLNLRNTGYEDCNVNVSDIEYIPSSK